jgi:TonB family protein
MRALLWVLTISVFASQIAIAVSDDAASQPKTSGKELVLHVSPPNSSHEWARKGIVGEGVVVATVNPKDGRVTDAYILKSTGQKRLDDAALVAFRKWRFKPNTVSKVKIPISFTKGI